MADPLKLATTEPISTSSPMTTLGGQLGQALGGGLQQLAANRLQRLQQQQQASGLANLIGGDQQLAANILSQPPEIQKQILGSGGFRTLAGQGQGQGQRLTQGLDLFTPAEPELTPYQKEQLALSRETLQEKKRRADTSEQALAIEKKQKFYNENIKPLVEVYKENKNEIDTLNKVKEIAKQEKKRNPAARAFDIALNKFKDTPLLETAVAIFRSDNAANTEKLLAQFIGGAKTAIGGRATNFEVQAFMKKYPNPFEIFNAGKAEEMLDDLIKAKQRVNDDIKRVRSAYKENPNLTLAQIDEILSPIDETATESAQQMQTNLESKKKNDLIQQVAQEQSMQPVQPQEQPVTTEIQPQQPEVTPQEQPEATQQEPNFLLEGLKPIDEGLRFQRNTIAQVLQPLITRFGGNVTKIAEYVQDKFGEGNISAISKLAQKIIPDEQQAQEYLKQMGVPEDELENPSRLVTGLQTAGVGIPLAISTLANPFGTIALIAAKGILSTVAPKLAGFATSLAGGEEKAQQAAEGATQILTDLLPLDFTKKAGKAKKLNELTKKEINEIAKSSETQIGKNKQAIVDLKQKKQADINSLTEKADEQIADLQKKISNVGISRKDYQKQIGSLYENIADLNKENAKFDLPDADRETLYEKLLNVRDDAFFPDKTKINQLIQKYKPRKAEELETGLLGATGKPITTTKISGEKRTLGDLFEDTKNLFALAKGSRRGSPIYEARDTVKTLAEKNASPEFIAAKRSLDAQYSAASKALDPIEIKRTQNTFREQIKNLKLDNDKQVNRIKENTDKEIALLGQQNNILEAAQKLDKSTIGENGFSASDIVKILVNPKFYLGEKGYKYAKEAFTLQPETQERLIFLKENYPDAFNKIEQAAEEVSKGFLESNQEAVNKASKILFNAINKGNNILNKKFK